MKHPDRHGLVTFGETMGLISASGIGRLEPGPAFGYGIGGAESNVRDRRGTPRRASHLDRSARARRDR